MAPPRSTAAALAASVLILWAVHGCSAEHDPSEESIAGTVVRFSAGSDTVDVTIGEDTPFDGRETRVEIAE